jgi:hypothetical protein
LKTIPILRSLVITGLLCAAAISPAGAVSLINLNFTGAMTGTRRQTFVDAAAFWNSTITGYTPVPVELGGGSGTANAPWNEVNGGAGNTGFASNLTGTDFSKELITGRVSSTLFLSNVTLGGLVDLGYAVDCSKAGVIRYTASAAPASASVPAPGVLPGVGLLTWRRSLAC